MYSDPIKIAGGAQCMAANHEIAREFVLEQNRKSMRLHGTRRVILMLHSDSGAYGGLAGGFGGDATAVAIRHERELQRRATNLRATIPSLETQTYFVDFDGIWEAEIGAPDEAQAPAVA